MKSRTPLSKPDAFNPAFATFLGNVIKGIRISPNDVTYWNGHCDELHEKLGFLHGIPEAVRQHWEISATLSVGTLKKKKLLENFQRKLDSDPSIELKGDVLSVINAMPVEETEREIRLTLVSPKYFGFDGIHPYPADVYPWGEICQKALIEGLTLCPPEVALLLLLNQTSIFLDGRITRVASRPMYPCSQDPKAFSIIRSECFDIDKLTLWVDNGGPNCPIAPYELIIFAVVE